MINGIARKVTKVADELIFYLLRAGSSDLKMDIRREFDKYIIILDANYSSEQRHAIKSLERMLAHTDRDQSIEEEYWELMGMNGMRHDPELQLIGMLVDHTEVIMGDHSVHIEIEKKLSI